MKINFKKNTIKWTALVALVTLATFFACKRTSDIQPSKDTFGVDQAKEWYYGYFKKSIYFKKLNVNSPFVGDFYKTISSRTSNTDARNIKKSPKWGLAQSVTQNGLQIVEMPILYDITTILLPGTQSKSQSVKEQLANASLNKILFIKKPNGQIAIRLVTIVPSIDYATSKNFDISNNNATNLEDNFSGYMMVRKWDETPIKTLKILNGNSYKNVTIRKMMNNVQTETEQSPCYFEWVPKIYRTCAVAYQGDEPDHECEEWDEVESPTEGSWELNEDCGIGGEHDEEDLCLLFNIGCEVDEEDPCVMYGNCGDEGDCSQHEDEAMSSLQNNFANHIKDVVEEKELNITEEIDPIYEDIKTWVVVKGQINSWRINAKTKIKLTKDNPTVNNNKTLELTHIESKFDGYNSLITTTWENSGHSEQINFNHTQTPIGRAIVWGTVHHEMKTEVKVDFRGCEFTLNPGLESFKDVRNELRVFKSN